MWGSTHVQDGNVWMQFFSGDVKVSLGKSFLFLLTDLIYNILFTGSVSIKRLPRNRVKRRGGSRSGIAWYFFCQVLLFEECSNTFLGHDADTITLENPLIPLI